MSEPTRKDMAGSIDRMSRGKDAPDSASIVHAGLGVLGTTIRRGFEEAATLGRRLTTYDLLGIKSLLAPLHDDSRTSPPEPVIAYRLDSGGWYDISVDSIIVDRVQGEEEAADRAGELLAAYAESTSADRDAATTGVVALGGGWYDVMVRGVPIDRVRGRDEARSRMDEILAMRS